MADPGSNRLAVLAGEIRAAHDAAVEAQQTVVQRARDAGLRLIEAKKLVGRGRWLPWLKEIGMPTSTAADYMRIAKLPDSEFTKLVNLGLHEALEAMVPEAPSPPPDEQKPEWSDDQLDRKERAEAGECVIANMHDDEALIAWAREAERLLRIDRATDWGNPFEIPDDGDRDEVVLKFEKFYWPHKPTLLEQIPDQAGKVLACWCYPERCHGHAIAETINRVAAGDGTAQQIADEIADHDG